MMISLLYHDVVSAGELASSGFPQADATVYKLSRPEFESHLEAIRNEVQGSEVILLNSGAQKIPAKALLFTFDDGGVSAMSIADQLEARRWRGHFFIATDFIGQTGFPHRLTNSGTARPRSFNWQSFLFSPASHFALPAGTAGS